MVLLCSLKQFFTERKIISQSSGFFLKSCLVSCIQLRILLNQEYDSVGENYLCFNKTRFESSMQKFLFAK